MANVDIKKIKDSNGISHLIDYEGLNNLPEIPTVTSTYSSAGTDAVNGIAVASAIENMTLPIAIAEAYPYGTSGNYYSNANRQLLGTTILKGGKAYYLLKDSETATNGQYVEITILKRFVSDDSLRYEYYGYANNKQYFWAYDEESGGQEQVVITVTDLTDSTKENVTNKVTSLSSASTDTEYPSAKCVYDLLGDVESILNTINGTEEGGE